MRDVGPRPAFGSKLHSSRPVAAFSANTRSFGLVPYSTPSTITGLVCISDPANASRVSYVHATRSRFTLAGVIWSSVL